VKLHTLVYFLDHSREMSQEMGVNPSKNVSKTELTVQHVPSPVGVVNSMDQVSLPPPAQPASIINAIVSVRCDLSSLEQMLLYELEARQRLSWARLMAIEDGYEEDCYLCKTLKNYSGQCKQNVRIIRELFAKNGIVDKSSLQLKNTALGGKDGFPVRKTSNVPPFKKH
jgi:hypothetical protein